jgi:hypothetical protein
MSKWQYTHKVLQFCFPGAPSCQDHTDYMPRRVMPENQNKRCMMMFDQNKRNSSWEKWQGNQLSLKVLRLCNFLYHIHKSTWELFNTDKRKESVKYLVRIHGWLRTASYLCSLHCFTVSIFKDSHIPTKGYAPT